MSNYRNVGGTSGGIGEFLIGVVMILIGGFMFFNNLSVRSNMFVLWGQGGSGLALLILLVGIGFLFFSARSWVGWALVIGGIGLIFYNVISNLTIYFRGTNFFTAILMLGLIFGGIGLVIRALRPHRA